MTQLFTPAEAIKFIRLYAPRVFASEFGEVDSWRTVELCDIPPVIIQSQDWRAFLCRVSHESCNEKIELPKSILVTYQLKLLLWMCEKAIGNELLFRFQKSGLPSLTLFFKKGEGEGALPFASMCGFESDEDEN